MMWLSSLRKKRERRCQAPHLHTFLAASHAAGIPASVRTRVARRDRGSDPAHRVLADFFSQVQQQDTQRPSRRGIFLVRGETTLIRGASVDVPVKIRYMISRASPPNAWRETGEKL